MAGPNADHMAWTTAFSFFLLSVVSLRSVHIAYCSLLLHLLGWNYSPARYCVFLPCRILFLVNAGVWESCVLVWFSPDQFFFFSVLSCSFFLFAFAGHVLSVKHPWGLIGSPVRGSLKVFRRLDRRKCKCEAWSHLVVSHILRWFPGRIMLHEMHTTFIHLHYHAMSVRCTSYDGVVFVFRRPPWWRFWSFVW